MVRRRSFGFASLALAMVAMLIGAQSACLPETPGGPTCPSPHPTFDLTVDAKEGSLSEDIAIHVRYGGGEESFRVESSVSPKVLYCDVVREESEGGHGPIRQVECELWTSGAATVSVTAKGYIGVVQDLEALKDAECGVLLTNSRITLEREGDRRKPESRGPH